MEFDTEETKMTSSVLLQKVNAEKLWILCENMYSCSYFPLHPTLWSHKHEPVTSPTQEMK